MKGGIEPVHRYQQMARQPWEKKMHEDYSEALQGNTGLVDFDKSLESLYFTSTIQYASVLQVHNYVLAELMYQCSRL